MTDVRTLRCPTCGAQLPASAYSSAWAVCDYCKAPLEVARPGPSHPLLRETAFAAPAAQPPLGGMVVRLHGVGQNKIGLIKIVRELTGLGLADAKHLVESRMPVDVHVTQRNVPVDARLLELATYGCQYETFGAYEPAHAPPAAAQPAPAGACVVVLEHTGPNKIAVIKEIREVTFCGLKEAKDLSEQTPSRFTLTNPKLSPDDLVRRFAAVGARVRLER